MYWNVRQDFQYDALINTIYFQYGESFFFGGLIIVIITTILWFGKDLKEKKEEENTEEFNMEEKSK